MKGSSKVKIRAKNLDKYAGVRRFRYGEAELEDLVGITTAWRGPRSAASCCRSSRAGSRRGRMTVTGKLGDVMQESVQAANAYVRSRANSFGIKPLSSRSATSTSTCPRVRRQGRPSAGVG